MINNTTIVIMMGILPHALSILTTIIVHFVTRKIFAHKISRSNKKTCKKYKTVKVILLVFVYISVFIVTRNAILHIDSNYNQKYDILGNKYSVSSEVVLYDENGNKYYPKSNNNSWEMFYTDENGNVYNANDIFLTKGGYIIHPDKDKVEYSSGVYDAVRVENEYYYIIIRPYWNEKGDLIVDYSGISPEYNVIITKDEQLDYQKEKNVKLYDMIKQD